MVAVAATRRNRMATDANATGAETATERDSRERPVADLIAAINRDACSDHVIVLGRVVSEFVAVLDNDAVAVRVDVARASVVATDVRGATTPEDAWSPNPDDHGSGTCNKTTKKL